MVGVVNCVAPHELFSSCLGYVLPAARRRHSPELSRYGVEIADLAQAGAMGLWQAAVAFDESRGLRFSTLAVRRMQGAMIDLIRAARGRFRRRPRHEPLHDEFAAQVRDTVAEADEVDWLRRQLAQLPVRQAEAMAHIADGASLVEAGRRMGVTGEGVWHLREKAMATLRVPA